MATLPVFYVDNVRLLYTDTLFVRGNVVADAYGNNITGIRIKNCENARAKNNKCLRLRSKTSNSIGFKIHNCDDFLALYNVSSRCNVGFDFEDIDTLNVYNLTSHNCTTHIKTDSDGYFRNIALSAYDNWKHYKNCTGFSLQAGAALDIDYMMYYGLGTLYSSNNVTVGSNIDEDKPIYMDEDNDDLTPDHISTLVNTGIDNPLRTTDPCIGGIESEVTDELTADRQYHYELLDNSFWDIENPTAAEVILIKAYQSRVLANAELAEQTVERNYYVKDAISVKRFSELYPMYARYANGSKFKKRVMDMWFSGQNPATLTAYNNSIGGYNLYPSFFKRLEDEDDFWIIDESYVDIDNYLLGYEGQKYGIVIDVLGLSTLSQATSGECYNNVMKSVADIATVHWNLHHEPQPDNYLLFTDLYNNFENCTLTNMVYNDDFNIEIDEVLDDGQLVTPLISTETVSASGSTIELSTLDRLNSESVIRKMYYRQGETSGSMGSWIEIDHPIGETIDISASYIQFKIVAQNVIRKIDYEFLGLCLRPYFSARDWTES